MLEGYQSSLFESSGNICYCQLIVHSFLTFKNYNLHTRVRMNDRGQCEDVVKCKLVMVGEQAVGKSSLVFKFVTDQFEDNYKCTIGASFLTKRVLIDGKIIQLDIWDTAGLERFQSLIPMYYRGANAALVVYDITNQESFLRAKTWVNEIKLKAETVVVTALVGNKSDRSEYRSVGYNNSTIFAKDHDLLFAETSAKTGENVNTVFLQIAKECAKKKAWTQQSYGRSQNKLRVNAQNTSSKSCCKT